MPETRTYSELRELGLCGRCKVVSVAPYCDRCIELRRAYRAAARERRAAAGKCVVCGRRKPSPDRVACRACEATGNAASRASHKRARKER